MVGQTDFKPGTFQVCISKSWIQMRDGCFEWEKSNSYSSPAPHFGHCAPLNYSLWGQSKFLLGKMAATLGEKNSQHDIGLCNRPFVSHSIVKKIVFSLLFYWSHYIMLLHISQILSSDKFVHNLLISIRLMTPMKFAILSYKCLLR